MADVTKDLKKLISRKMFQVVAMAHNITNSLDQNSPSTLLTDFQVINKCCDEAVIAVRTLLTTYPAEQHDAKQADTHTEHCCKLCGCKYGDDREDNSCPVANGSKPQTYPCRGECYF